MMRTMPYALLAALVITACGFGAPPESAPRPVMVTQARDVTLEERDTDGRLLWSVRSMTVSEESARFDCDSIALSVTDPGTGTSAAPDWRARLGTGLEANASKGRIERETSSTLVRLRDGFTLRLGTGWEARGASMTWDGERAVTDGAVRLERPGIAISASRAVIVPSRNRIALERVEGTVDGVTL